MRNWIILRDTIEQHMSGLGGKLFQHNDDIRNGGEFCTENIAAIAVSILNSKMDTGTNTLHH
jgi:hypothetical protein